MREQLNPWLGEPKWKLNEGRATFIYRFDSESLPITPMRLKVEINTREHFAVLGFLQKNYDIESAWFSKQATITTYTLEELLGTKLRALYQRKKGRDLFDLAMALEQFPALEVSKLVDCFSHYMAFTNAKISRAEFEANLAEKANDAAFMQDIFPLLPSMVSSTYDPSMAIERVRNEIICGLSGEAWKG